MFKFVHTADLHLDSRLRRLEHYEGAPADRIRNATRQALENLVRLAVAEKVAFVLIAGDLYDDDLDDYTALLFFGRQMAELGRHGIRVFLIRGNHDAANHMSRALELPDHVQLFGEQQPETVRLDELHVAVHGQSFASREVRENLAAAYPDPVSGWFNIGLLHTSLQGSDRHGTYAPCTLDHLRQRGYDYWALGHIHHRETKHPQRPVVLYPGNIQGRHVRETGPKGCHVITVRNREVIANEFRPLDVMRWAWLTIDATKRQRPEDVLQDCFDELRQHVDQAEGRLLAVRVEVTGASAAHADLATRREYWLNQFRSDCLNRFAQDVWLESLRLSTRSPQDDSSEAFPEDALEQLRQVIADLEGDEARLGQILEQELKHLDKKLPSALKIGDEAIHPTKAAFGKPLLGRIIPLLTHLQASEEEAP
jgi:DNA repair exonuclease SbcCD nuclease subunit